MRTYSVSEYVTGPPLHVMSFPDPTQKSPKLRDEIRNGKIRRALLKFIDATSSKLITKLRAKKVLCHRAEVASGVATTVQLVCCPMYMDSCLSCDLPIW